MILLKHLGRANYSIVKILPLKKQGAKINAIHNGFSLQLILIGQKSTTDISLINFNKEIYISIT